MLDVELSRMTGPGSLFVALTLSTLSSNRKHSRPLAPLSASGLRHVRVIPNGKVPHDISVALASRFTYRSSGSTFPRGLKIGVTPLDMAAIVFGVGVRLSMALKK